MNTPVSFELAKLLKEKGFDEVCQQWYSVEGGLYYQDEFDNNRGFIPVCECEAPTIAEVVMWLYEKYKIWISVGGDCDYKFKFEIHKWNWYELEKTYRLGHVILGESFWDTSSKAFDSPTEAYEAAIEHALKYLI